MYKKIITFSLIFFALFLINTNLVFADACQCSDGSQYNVPCDNCATTCSTHDGQASCTTGGTSSGDTTFPNPIGTDSIQVLIGKIIQAVLGIVGSLALIMFIYGGFTWMMASGNQQAVQKGKDILIWATVGLVVIFTAYALVRFVLLAVTA